MNGLKWLSQGIFQQSCDEYHTYPVSLTRKLDAAGKHEFFPSLNIRKPEWELVL